MAKTLAFKKGNNLCIVEHQGMDFISHNDLTSPMKRETGKVCDGEVIKLYTATDGFVVDCSDTVYVEDTASLRGWHISGARPKDITKR